MTREILDQWQFVYASYALGIGGTLTTAAWSWLTMCSAERRRDRSREQ
jgi:hypothetical protein